jgi:hypothetical protein
VYVSSVQKLQYFSTMNKKIAYSMRVVHSLLEP